MKTKTILWLTATLSLFCLGALLSQNINQINAKAATVLPNGQATGEPPVATFSRGFINTTGDIITPPAFTVDGTMVTTTATQTLTNKVLTSPIVTGAVITDSTEVVAATNVITAAESGKTFFLNHATEFVSTLPAPAAGLRFTFICANAPETASYTIVTTSSANIIVGHVLTSQDAGGNANSETSGGDTVTLVDSKAVVGDIVEVWSDGTNWFVRASCKTFDAITISTAS